MSKDVLKKAKQLPTANKRKLTEFIQELQKTPFPQGFDIVPVKGKKAKQLKGNNRSIYRVRLGEYRLIYIVNWKEKIISLTELNPRGKAYK
ncbi:MAG: type II toxin-antitoxin system RelE/ParE family toxin [Methanomassiliicoccales archaeon]|nr:type II toxin-antitoxin system RelE/ParE family toxin [Methanomassiliicoccales archaeon]